MWVHTFIYCNKSKFPPFPCRALVILLNRTNATSIKPVTVEDKFICVSVSSGKSCLTKLWIFPWDLFTNWSELIVASTQNADQYVDRSLRRNSNLGKTRKKGSTQLVAIHHSNIQLQDTITNKGWRFEKEIPTGLRLELENVGFKDQRLDN